MPENIDNVDDTDEGSDGGAIQAARDAASRWEAKAKEAVRQAETAKEEAVAEVRREQISTSLMKKAGFEGLADVFASEVDGELTDQAAEKWLTGRGLKATTENIETAQGTDSAAGGLEAVASLGSQVASAATGSTDTTFDGRMDKVADGFKGSALDLAEAIEKEFADLG